MKKTLLFFGLLLFNLQINAQSYCTDGGPSSEFDSNVENVDLVGENSTIISHAGCPGVPGVEDLTAQSVDLIAGNTYTIDVQFGTCGGNFPGVGEVWIDYNLDFSFQASESIGTETGTPPFPLSSFTFTVPSDAINGTSRLRVMQQEGGTLPLDPCADFTWGSVMDFEVNISGGVDITCQIPFNVSLSNITATSVDVAWDDEPNAVDGYLWEVYNAGEDPSAATPVAQGSFPSGSTSGQATGLPTSSVLDFYLASNCGATDGLSDFNGPFQFTTSCTTFSAPYTDNFDGAGWTPGTGFDNAGDAINLCWTRNPESGFFWGTRTGETNSALTGPDAANSPANYVFVESSAGAAGDEALLISPSVDLSNLNSPALFFWYHMFGDDTGSLTVDVITSSGTDSDIFSLTGEQQGDNSDPWIEQILDLSSYAGQTIQVQFRSIKGSGFNGDIAIDDFAIDEAPSCLTPTSFTAISILSDSILVSWDQIANATNGYIWEVYSAGDDPETEAPILNGTFAAGSTQGSISGLVANTSYDVYLISDCGPADGLSELSTPISFTTSCNAFPAPYSENFDGSDWVSGSGGANTEDSIDSCWSRNPESGFFWGTRSGTTTSGSTGPENANSGANYVFAETSSGAEGDEATFVSPFVDLSTLNNPALFFWYHMYGSDMGSLSVDVITSSGTDLDVATIVGEQQGDNTDPWIEQILDLSAYSGQSVQVQFRAIRGSGLNSDIAIDDFAIDEAPTCLSPGPVTISNETSNGADISWTGVSNAVNGYNWSIFLAGADPTTDTPVESGSAPAGTTSIIISTLLDGTDYDFYITSDCGTVNGESETVGPIPFQTLFLPPANDNVCDAIPLTVGVVPPADTYFNFAATEEANEPIPGCFNDGINGSVWFTFVAPASGEVEVSTEILPGGTLTDTELAVYDEPTDCADLSTFTTDIGCSQDDGNDGIFTASEIQLTGLTAGATYYVQVDSWGTAAPGTFGIYVIDSNPPCPNPENVQFVSSTTDSASFTWDDVVEETDGYNWFVYNAGDNTQTATPLFSGNVGADVTSVTVNGLAASTTYDFYVQANCGATDGLSILSNPTTFATQCTVFSTPYVETFDGATWISGTGFGNADDAIDNCWSRNTVGPDYFWGTRTGATGSGNTGPSAANSPANYVFTESSNGLAGDEATFDSPLLDLSNLNDPALFFWYHLNGADMGTLTVDVITSNGIDLDIFSVSGPQQAADTDPWIEQIIDLSAYAGQTIQIRFRSIKGDGFTSDMAIDDFAVDEAPSCLKPVNLTAVEVFFDSVEVSWGPVGNATSGYIWEVYLAGDDPATTTPVSSGTFPAGSTQGIADGLSPATDYDIYIASDCGAVDGQSDFTGPTSFTTTVVCALPATFDVINVSDVTAELTWSSIPNASDGYDWAIFNAGDDPLNDQPVQSGNAPSDSNSVLITGLTQQTSYDAYITTNCGAQGPSTLSDAVNFLTTFTPTIVTVDAPPINETFCYDNNQVLEFLYTSSDGTTPVELVFNSGTIEDGTGSGDRCRIFDGFDDTAPLLYDSDVDGTDMAGVTLTANSGTAYVIMEADIFGSCASPGVDVEVPFDFDIFAGTFSTDQFDLGNFSFYPNPASNLLNLETTNRVEDIQVFNIVGQSVIHETPNTVSPSINVEALQSGTYLMNVTIDGVTQNFKFIKE